MKLVHILSPSRYPRLRWPGDNVGDGENELVQDRGWLSKQEMRDAIAVSRSLPGPLAIQVGILPNVLTVQARQRGERAR